jgi:rRNA-processing protein FCF1
MAPDRIRRNREKQIVLLDTSALFMIFENNIRIEDELDRLLGAYEIYIIQQIYNEINFLKDNGTNKQKQLSKMVLPLLSRYQSIQGKMGKTADDALFKTAMDISCTVVTNDGQLRKKLLKNNITTICLRGKNQLMIC